MASYYINNNQQANGDYEVHRQGCLYFPTQDYTYLGEFYHVMELSKRLKIDIHIDIGLMAATPAVTNAILLDLST